MEHYEIYKSLTDLPATVFLARKFIEVNDLLNVLPTRILILKLLFMIRFV